MIDVRVKVLVDKTTSGEIAIAKRAYQTGENDRASGGVRQSHDNSRGN